VFQPEEVAEHHKKKKKKKKKEKYHHHRPHGRLRPQFIEETEESEEDDEWLYTRSTRERKAINYNFTDYDNMINDAIAGDDREEEFNPGLCFYYQNQACRLSQAYRDYSFSQPPFPLNVFKSSEKNDDGGRFQEIKHADPSS
jgi:hypothetical protein